MSFEAALRWMPQYLTDDYSVVVQVIAWRRQVITWAYIDPNLCRYRQQWAIRTLHDCPSQMNENLLISNSKLTSDSELIWWR